MDLIHRRLHFRNDPDVQAFIAVSGATDVTVVNQLVRFLKAQSLYDHVRFFPYKSAQNAGSGTTVYGLGGWTSNNITLVNGPSWGSSGVTFDATDDRGSVSLTGVEALSELYAFNRQNPPGGSLADTSRFGVFMIGDLATSKYIYFGAATGVFSGETVSVGVNNDRRFGSSQPAWSAGVSTQLVVRLAQTGFAIWKSKTSQTIDKTSGTQDFRPSESGFTTNSVVNINAFLNSTAYSSFLNTVRVADLFCKTALTQAQRESITDYIDAL